MWQYRSNRTFSAVVWLAIGLQAASCGLVDLRPVTVTLEPHEANAVLDSREAFISVDFSEEPIRLEAERAFSVESAAGAVEGDFSWSGWGFTWKPVKPWDPGLRYRLLIKGSIGTAGGREARLSIDLPFYAVRASMMPVLACYWPPDGQSTGVHGQGDAAIELRFSEAMDSGSVLDAFSLSPSAGFDMVWDPSATIATIVPDERLEPCSVYRWTLEKIARAIDGSPLAMEEKASFVTDLDRTAPSVVRTYAVVRGIGAWVEIGSGLGGVDTGHSIAILFSEAVDASSVLSGVRLESGESGHVDVVTPNLVVYTPEQDWEPGKSHTLAVSTDVKDASGICMVEEYRERFTPIVPFLRVLRATAAAGETLDDVGNLSTLPVSVGVAPEGLLSLTLNFTGRFDVLAKVAASGQITLVPFFPGSLPAPRLRSVVWFSDDTVTLTWEGLRRSDPISDKYYKLSVPGGPGGVTSGSGHYLEREVSLLLVAKE
ncbi:MAG: hypothetical protein CVV51_03995 [Spirochaetae bacterium HGW-Spirochaetae-7]|nr:MAG: hypothetical protein CVV51_03995 [Spirochaetae bacterium HGW-Spirochaetae-7]